LFLLIRLIDKKAKPLGIANGLSADLDLFIESGNEYLSPPAVAPFTLNAT